MFTESFRINAVITVLAEKLNTRELIEVLAEPKEIPGDKRKAGSTLSAILMHLRM